MLLKDDVELQFVWVNNDLFSPKLPVCTHIWTCACLLAHLICPCPFILWCTFSSKLNASLDVAPSIRRFKFSNSDWLYFVVYIFLKPHNVSGVFIKKSPPSSSVLHCVALNIPKHEIFTAYNWYHFEFLGETGQDRSNNVNLITYGGITLLSNQKPCNELGTRVKLNCLVGFSSYFCW